MGLFDVISGKRKLKQPAPDRLFAMSTAYVTLQTELELTSRGVAGIVFQALEPVFELRPVGPLAGDELLQINDHKSCLCLTVRYCAISCALRRSFSSSEK